MKTSDIFLHYFHNTDYVGEFPAEQSAVKSVQLGTPENGMVIHLQAVINNNVIQDIRYRVYGNSAAIASAAFAAHFLKNKTLVEAKQLTYQMIMERLSLPVIYQYCAVMVVEAVKKVVQDNF